MAVEAVGVILALSIVRLVNDNLVLLFNKNADKCHLYTNIEKVMCR